MKKIFLLTTAVFLAVVTQAQVTVSNVVPHNNGTYTNTTDDYISFYMNGAFSTLLSPFTFNVTATQNGNPVTVYLADGTPAVNLRYTTRNLQFRLADGSAGKGNAMVTYTPNWTGATPETVTIADPGVMPIPLACAPGSQTISYTYLSPYNSTNAANWQAHIPKFDATGGKVLTGVAITATANVWTSAMAEGLSLNNNNEARIRVQCNPWFNYNGTALSSSLTTIFETAGFDAFDFVPIGTGSAISVPASGSWPGDLGGSTLDQMNSFYRSFVYAGIDPRTSPQWVTNATSPANAANDDDMLISLFNTVSRAFNYTYTTPADLANFTGTGNIPFTYSTLMPTTQQTSGSATSGVMSQTQYLITVTYTYTNSPCYNISGTIFNDADGAVNGIKNLSGVNTNLGLNAVLVDANGIVVGTTTVNPADGTYTFAEGKEGQSYKVMITTGTATAGAAAPAVILPNNWTSTGEFNGPGTGNDGTADGQSATFTMPAANVTQVDFGIRNQLAGNPLSANIINVLAKLAGGQLMVSFTTLSENNNSHFEIEASKNGNHFAAIGQISSKAVNGISNAALHYDFATNANTAWAMGLGILLLGGSCVISSRKHKIMLSVITALFFTTLLISCSKENDTVADSGDVFIRIAQVDKDGTKTYSKVVKLIKE